jgi:hypothetical protein
MTLRQALEQIAHDAKEYAADKRRFQPLEVGPEITGTENLHIWREGKRDGLMQAGRLAEAALEDQA